MINYIIGSDAYSSMNCRVARYNVEFCVLYDAKEKAPT